MKNNNYLYSLFDACDKKGKFVYEVVEMFGSELTQDELEYWMAFDVMKNAILNNIDVKCLSFEDTIDEIKRIRDERLRELEKIKAGIR